MKRSVVVLLAGAVLGTCIPSHADPEPQYVLSYHGHPDRSGNFVVPALTWERARSLRLDEGFRPHVSGHVYAQPLYWRVPGSSSAILLLATEDNIVQAIDAGSGNEVWKRSLGTPVARSSLPCGNIDPLGVTGTPVIDKSTEAIYLDAVVDGPSGPRHLVFALSLTDGSPMPGWPVDVANALEKEHQNFVSRRAGLQRNWFQTADERRSAGNAASWLRSHRQHQFGGGFSSRAVYGNLCREQTTHWRDTPRRWTTK